MIDYYQVLSLPPTASLAEIKLAYHSLLLKYHPDKNVHYHSESETIDIGLLKDAYSILSSPPSRAQYDASLTKHKEEHKYSGPRPAQVISLEEFTQLDLEGKDDTWEHPCRCGGKYRICEADMEQGQHLIGCRNCSEVVWVGYEEVQDDGKKKSS